MPFVLPNILKKGRFWRFFKKSRKKKLRLKFLRTQGKKLKTQGKTQALEVLILALKIACCK